MILAVCAAAGLVGCSSTPQWVKPNTWVDGLFGPPAPATSSAEPPQADEYPDLSQVPDRPAPTSTPAERGRVVEGLIADRANAKHAAETLRGGSSGVYAPTASSSPIEPAAAPAGQGEAKPATEAEGATPEGTNEEPPAAPPAPSVGEQARIDVPTDAPQAANCARVMPVNDDRIARLFALYEEGHNAAAISVPAVAPQTRVLSDMSATQGLVPTPKRRPNEIQLASADGGRGIGAWPAEAVSASLGQLPLQPTMIAPTESDVLTTSETVYFAKGSAKVAAFDQGHLRQAAKLFARRGGLIRVVGHASPETSAPSSATLIANFAISLKRANAVARALMARGVPASAIVIDALGDSLPLYGAEIPQGEAFNRRVEILFEEL